MGIKEYRDVEEFVQRVASAVEHERAVVRGLIFPSSGLGGSGSTSYDFTGVLYETRKSETINDRMRVAEFKDVYLHPQDDGDVVQAGLDFVHGSLFQIGRKVIRGREGIFVARIFGGDTLVVVDNNYRSSMGAGLTEERLKRVEVIE
jgi:hypothetical protein